MQTKFFAARKKSIKLKLKKKKKTQKQLTYIKKNSKEKKKITERETKILKL